MWYAWHVSGLIDRSLMSLKKGNNQTDLSKMTQCSSPLVLNTSPNRFYAALAPNGSKWLQMAQAGSKWLQVGPNSSLLVHIGQRKKDKKSTNIKIKIKLAMAWTSGLVYMDFVWKRNIDLKCHCEIICHFRMLLLKKNIYIPGSMGISLHTFLVQKVLTLALFV